MKIFVRHLYLMDFSSKRVLYLDTLIKNGKMVEKWALSSFFRLKLYDNIVRCAKNFILTCRN